MDDRLATLEIRYAELADLVEKLNAALIEQQREIDALRGDMKRTRDHLASEPWGEAAPANDPPPHY